MSTFYATIARYYDAEHQDKTDDLMMYTELADQHGGPIFEFGCGTGRVLLHLAQAGHECHGIDFEPAMLERARRKLEALPHVRQRVKLMEGDVLKVPLKGQYALTLITYNGLLHFHEQEQQLALLKRLRGITQEEGRLVLDLPNPADSFGAQETDALLLDRTFLDPESGHLVMQYSTSQLDRTTQKLHVTWIYDEIAGDGVVKRTFAPVVWRYYFYAELRLLLQLSGFAVEEVFGSTDFDPFEDGCERMIVLAKPV
jgi:ubiquinone/menaquinone biosynthesis C-methylase UbiE